MVSLMIGADLYLKGIGSKEDGTEIKKGGMELKLKTAGSVVMATSIAWAYLAYLSIPEPYTTTEVPIEIGPFKGSMKMRSFTNNTSPGSANIRNKAFLETLRSELYKDQTIVYQTGGAVLNTETSDINTEITGGGFRMGGPQTRGYVIGGGEQVVVMSRGQPKDEKEHDSGDSSPITDLTISRDKNGTIVAKNESGVIAKWDSTDGGVTYPILQELLNFSTKARTME
jgi:hypothetical protein